jgi:predicted site-specific integrase-resolvase
MYFKTAKEAAKYYKISLPQLRNKARHGKIPAEQIPNGRYRYIIPTEPEPLFEQINLGERIIYTRVSSKKQFCDLERQTKSLREKYPDYKIVSDVGSGINYKRKGFKAILEQLFRRNIKEVVVAHRDRFSRFGFDFFQWMFQEFGAELISLDCKKQKGEEDLVGDIMEIFTVFTARYYGKRKYITSGEENSNPSDDEPKDVVS